MQSISKSIDTIANHKRPVQWSMHVLMASITELSHLTNPIATPAQLQKSSSQLDDVPSDLEDSIRYEGAKLIQGAGVLLRLPQELIAEAIIIFSRFWIGSDGGSLVEYGAKVCLLSISPGFYCQLTSLL